MKKPTLRRALALLFVCALWPLSAAGQNTPGVTGAGLATFTTATSYNGVALTGFDYGIGVQIPGDTSATGALHCTLQGTGGQHISIDGHATSGSILGDGSATFSGTATVDMGDGSTPSTGVSFTLTAVPNGAGRGTLTLTIGSTKLAAGTIQDGGNLTIG
jgi:hypothetical protein